MGMSRRLLTTSSAHASRPTPHAAGHVTAGTLLDRHVRRADRGHQPEEREHEHLAETEIAVRLGSTGVAPGGEDRRRTDERAATTSSATASARPSTAASPRQQQRRPLDRRWRRRSGCDQPHRPDAHVVGAAHAVAVVVGVVDADLQQQRHGERHQHAPPRRHRRRRYRSPPRHRRPPGRQRPAACAGGRRRSSRRREGFGWSSMRRP